jgi:hypothetical protein
MGWRPVEPADISTRDDFERLTPELVSAGGTNSDRMRDRIPARSN